MFGLMVGMHPDEYVWILKVYLRSPDDIITAKQRKTKLQMGIVNKEIGFLCGLKFFALNIFCGEYLQLSLYLMLQIWWKPLLWKMCQ